MGTRGRLGVLAVLAIALLALGPTALRVLRAWSHHGPAAALAEVRGYGRAWMAPSVAYDEADPALAGLAPAKLEVWRRELARHHTRQLLVVRGGRLVYEWYAPGRGPDDAENVSAVAKGTAGALALGAMLDDGLVALDDPAWKYVPAWQHDPVRSRIRIRQLLNHTSGMQNIVYGGDSAGLSGWERVFSDDHTQRFPLTLTKARMLFPPGERVRYTSLSYYALSYALTVALRGSAYPDLRVLLERRIMEPLAIGADAWRFSYGRHDEMDGMRLYTLASGAAYTPRALARIGELMLGGGAWAGRRILSAETVAELVSTRGLPEDRPRDEPLPALGWWTNAEGVFPSLPRDAFVAGGAQQRLVWVVPSLDLVAVRLGQSLHDDGAEHRYWDQVDALVFAPLMAAVGDAGVTSRGR